MSGPQRPRFSPCEVPSFPSTSSVAPSVSVSENAPVFAPVSSMPTGQEGMAEGEEKQDLEDVSAGSRALQAVSETSDLELSEARQQSFVRLMRGQTRLSFVALIQFYGHCYGKG